jgi:transcriptional regulator GlxA family with amidase domain
MTRAIGFLVFPGFQILDVAGPLAAFQIAAEIAGEETYRLQVVSRQGGMIRSTAGLGIATERAGHGPFDTILISGTGTPLTAVEDSGLIALVRSLAASSRRTASICTGAFILGAAGLLDGRRVTTHWGFAAQLQRRYPRARVDGERIFVRDGAIWSSAGITAGIDLALSLIEADLGDDVARTVAQTLVVYQRRAGGQSQFSAMLELEPRSDRVRQVLVFAREHLHEALPLERLATAACLSPRQFGRIFRAETGETPARAVERLRAEAARVRVEGSVEPIEGIAAAVGFSDPERMRRAFLRVFGQPPQALRRLARSTKP